MSDRTELILCKIQNYNIECNFSSVHELDDSFFWNPEALVILGHFGGTLYILFYHNFFIIYLSFYALHFSRLQLNYKPFNNIKPMFSEASVNCQITGFHDKVLLHLV